MDTPERIKALREKQEMSREELARKLGTTRLRVWRVETGKTKLRVEDLASWARALKVRVAELLA